MENRKIKNTKGKEVKGEKVKGKDFKTQNKKPKKIARRRQKGIFNARLLQRKICIPFTDIGSNIKEHLQHKLATMLENKCCNEGFIQNNSIKISEYSSGNIDGNNVYFDVSFECLVCRPVEGTTLQCKVINITKAGIRAVFYDEKNEQDNPLTIFIARDHHYNNEYFSKIEINDVVMAKIIGVRYELNDTNIFAISELLEKKSKIKISIHTNK